MSLVDTTSGELVTLASLEEVIERGMASFVEVGEALLTIRERKLYLDTHRTWDAYCRERWGFDRTRAHRYIEASEVASMLPIGNMPTNEAQARELAPLKDNPEAMSEAMAAAIERTNGKPTAAVVTEAVKEVIEREKVRKTDVAEQKASEKKHQPEGFDREAEARRVEQLGSFSAACQWFSKNKEGSPQEVFAAVGDALKERHIGYAEAAYAWLDEFLLLAREER